MLVAEEAGPEAAIVPGLPVVGVATLREAVAWARASRVWAAVLD